MDIELCVGVIAMILLYLLGRVLYPEVSNHQRIIPEPNKLLINYGEAVGQIYGGEEE
tara:strand:+ start:252 stop:422 length:171 start_codon:yes stop_codon:yes gene_type:complete